MKEAFWQAFRETGDPLCYLLYCAFGGTERRTEREESPRSA